MEAATLRARTLLAVLLLLASTLGAAAAFVLAPDAPASTEALAFSPATAVAPRITALSEPNVVVAPNGDVFVANLGPAWVPVVPAQPGLAGRFGATHVYKRDAGATGFRLLSFPNLGAGGIDEALAMGEDGTLYVAGMYFTLPIVPAAQAATGNVPLRCTSVTKSTDGGETWSDPYELACVAHRTDRPWIAVDAASRVIVTGAHGGPEGSHEAVWSPNGGDVFLPGGVTKPIRGGFPGNVFVDRERELAYEASVCQIPVVAPLALCLSRSPTTAPLPAWELLTPVPLQRGVPILNHVTGAVDDAGNLYVAFADVRGGESAVGVYVARSTDGGESWSAPERVSGAGTALFPWIVAGADGGAAVAWYEADEPQQDPSKLSESATWRVRVASRSWPDAWATADVTPSPTHVGPVCTSGVSCNGQNRELGEFFEMAIGPDGRLHLAFTDTLRNVIAHAEQSGGATLR